MVKAILEDRKTMTRRTKGLDKINKTPDEWELFLVFPGDSHTLPLWNFRKKNDPSSIEIIKCPYEIGRILWVKETYCLFKDGDIYCKADNPAIITHLGTGAKIKWKSGMFMPRWANRIKLEIRAVRCERLQEISYEDMLKEGFPLKEYKQPTKESTEGCAGLW